MAVWLYHILCPKRHCIVAAPYDPVATTARQVEIDAIAFMMREGIRPLCGLCGSEDLSGEHIQTPFRRLDEILPLMEELARQQALTRAAFQHHHLHRN